MQTQSWKFAALALSLAAAVSASGSVARGDDAQRPGVVRLDRIGEDGFEPTSNVMPPAPFAPDDGCLGPPPAPCSGVAGGGPCGPPCEKKRGCCLFRCCSSDDDYDECENDCEKPKRRCCCLCPWGRKDQCEAHGNGECDNGRCACCRWLTCGLFGGGAKGYGAREGYGHYPYGSPAEMRLAHLRCKMGYFIPTGDCGNGLPWAGHYKLVYPLNPDFHDPRDSRVYSAQGYGVPVGVPLAPNVEFTYNYGWGVPSSRLTPVSRHVPGTNPILWPIPPGQRY